MATANNVHAWSTTAASNSGADSDVGTIADSSQPDTVDNWSRGIMAGVKGFANDLCGAKTAGGTAQALTLTTDSDISASHLTDGYRIGFWAKETNTGADPNIAIDGNSAITIKDANGDDLAAGDIQSGAFVDLAYEAGAGVFHAVNIRPVSSTLQAISALAVTDGNIIVGDGSTWVAENGATARTSLGLGTGNSPQFTGIELGHASDTTLTRSGSGVLAVEGNNVVTVAGATITGAMEFDGAVALDGLTTMSRSGTADVLHMRNAAYGVDVVFSARNNAIDVRTELAGSGARYMIFNGVQAFLNSILDHAPSGTAAEGDRALFRDAGDGNWKYGLLDATGSFET